MGLFGKCRHCGSDATGCYYGGSDGLCDSCRRKEKEKEKERAFRAREEYQKAREEAIKAIAAKYNCPEAAALVILNREN